MKHLLLPLALLAAAACAAEVPQEGCADDSTCPAGQFCDAGTCKCRTDDQCGSGQYCNAYGNCQERPACLGNLDCGDGFICNGADRTGGTCIPDDQCGSSLHCPIGYYCRIASGDTTGTCVVGCRQTGDCTLGEVCVAGACEAAASATDCFMCPTQPDPNPTYCDYGEKCTYAGNCERIPEASGLCSRCSPVTDECGTGLVCLIDEDSAGLNYCTSTCETAADCPNGYSGSCGHVVLVAGGCNSDNDCFQSGGQCIESQESDQPYCTFGDASFCDLNPTCDFGTCTPMMPCQNSTDCQALQPGSTCDGFFGACMFDCGRDSDCTCIGGRCPATGMPCTPATAASDCALSFIPVGSGPDGVCETNIGVCGKEAGANCTELTTGTATCRDLAN
jgi:Cys-rich repeat protein